jgi:topoisomerase-4 subunit A
MKIRAEQAELAEERDSLAKTLGSEARLTTLIRKELQAVAEEFGDARRSPLVSREEARAYSETELVSSEPVTVVLSEKGWIRAAKGFDIDPEKLGYKAGDAFKCAVQGRSNQSVLLLDSTGRTYSLPAHSLPSARGQGEPLTGRINPPSGASFAGALMGEDSQLCLLASDAGYGFVARLEDLHTKNRAGKAVLSLPEGAEVLAPVCVGDLAKDLLVAVSNEGRMLVFPVAELPMLARGKGNKIIGISGTLLRAREEYMLGVVAMAPGATVVVHSGKRYIKLRGADLDAYRGERGRRGNKLPRGFQKVDRIGIAAD